ncbi:Tip elongation aberrant protein 1 [Diplonema papillatum]|nr:Tip elongation aberrant protein 1 [Diplonema papillatum]|eukprot:gene23350-35763_t
MEGHSFVCLPDATVACFGGRSGAKYTNDLWLVQVSGTTQTAVWELTAKSAQVPTPRAYHTATLWRDAYMVVIGGVGQNRPQPVTRESTFHVWDRQAGWHQQSAGGEAPVSRCNHSASLAPNGNGIFLYGGYPIGQATDELLSVVPGTTQPKHRTFFDVYELCLASEVPLWRRIEAVNPPPMIWGHGCTLYAGNLLVFGGVDVVDSSESKHLCVWNTAHRHWQWVDFGDAPEPRALHTACENPFQPAQVVFHGGFGSGNAVKFNDTWVFSAADGHWATVNTHLSVHKPPPRSGHAAVVIPLATSSVVESLLLVHGGTDPTGTALSDLHLLNMATGEWFPIASTPGSVEADRPTYKALLYSARSHAGDPPQYDGIPAAASDVGGAGASVSHVSASHHNSASERMSAGPMSSKGPLQQFGSAQIAAQKQPSAAGTPEHLPEMTAAGWDTSSKQIVSPASASASASTGIGSLGRNPTRADDSHAHPLALGRPDAHTPRGSPDTLQLDGMRPGDTVGYFPPNAPIGAWAVDRKAPKHTVSPLRHSSPTRGDLGDGYGETPVLPRETTANIPRGIGGTHQAFQGSESITTACVALPKRFDVRIVTEVISGFMSLPTEFLEIGVDPSPDAAAAQPSAVMVNEQELLARHTHLCIRIAGPPDCNEILEELLRRLVTPGDPLRDALGPPASVRKKFDPRTPTDLLNGPLPAQQSPYAKRIDEIVPFSDDRRWVLEYHQAGADGAAGRPDWNSNRNATQGVQTVPADEDPDEDHAARARMVEKIDKDLILQQKLEIDSLKKRVDEAEKKNSSIAGYLCLPDDKALAAGNMPQLSASTPRGPKIQLTKSTLVDLLPMDNLRKHQPQPLTKLTPAASAHVTRSTAAAVKERRSHHIGTDVTLSQPMLLATARTDPTYPAPNHPSPNHPHTGNAPRSVLVGSQADFPHRQPRQKLPPSMARATGKAPSLNSIINGTASMLSITHLGETRG